MAPTAILVVVLSVCSQALANNERHLANQLLGHYPSPKFIRPVEDPADSVPLYLRYTAVTISDFDDDAGQLTINGYVKTMWKDEFMTWDEEEQGVRNLRFELGNIWTPDIRSYQGMGHQEYAGENFRVVSFPNGKILSVLPSTHKVQCEAAQERGHYDCQFNLGSWTYPQAEVETHLFPNKTGLSLSWFKPSLEWDIRAEESSASVIGRTYDCCPNDVYQSLEINLHVVHVEHEHGHGHGHHDHDEHHEHDDHDHDDHDHDDQDHDEDSPQDDDDDDDDI